MLLQLKKQKIHHPHTFPVNNLRPMPQFSHVAKKDKSIMIYYGFRLLELQNLL